MVESEGVEDELGPLNATLQLTKGVQYGSTVAGS